MKTKVVNLRKSKYDIYIGRAIVFVNDVANPIRHPEKVEVSVEWDYTESGEAGWYYLAS